MHRQDKFARESDMRLKEQSMCSGAHEEEEQHNAPHACSHRAPSTDLLEYYHHALNLIHPYTAGLTA